MSLSTRTDRQLIRFTVRHHAVVSAIGAIQTFSFPEPRPRRSPPRKTDEVRAAEAGGPKARGTRGAITTVGGAKGLLFVLDGIFRWLRSQSPNGKLPTELHYLLSRYRADLRQGRDSQKTARALGNFLEERFLGYTVVKEAVFLVEEAKLLYVDGAFYDSVRWMRAARMYCHFYKHGHQNITSKDLRNAGLYRHGRLDNIKRILDTLPIELRAHIVDMGKSGRIYAK